MINNERIAQLTTLGLTEQQARAYLALLDVDTATVNDLANSSRVPRAKLYEVLDGLSRKGLLETIPDTPHRVRAKPLTALYDTRAEELRSEERELKRSISELVLQLVPNPKEAAPESERDFLHFAKGRTVFVSSFRQILERATTSILIVGDKLLLPRLRLYEDLYGQLCQFQNQGELCVLVPRDAVKALEGRPVDVGEIVRSVRSLSTPGTDSMLVLRDDCEVLSVHFLPNDLHPSRGTDRIVVNRDADLAQTQSHFVRAAWSTATAPAPGLALRRP